MSDAVRKTLTFNRRLVFAGYRQSSAIGAKTLSVGVAATAVAAYAAVILTAFWRPAHGGWLAVLAAFGVIALAYGAFGLRPVRRGARLPRAGAVARSSRPGGRGGGAPSPPWLGRSPPSRRRRTL
jgi:hypothetical protein